MKAMFINGSPRKGWSTHKLLEAAMQGAAEAGAETELVHLYDMMFHGCTSCFACKVKGSRTNGVCAMRDELRPVLERCMESDAIVIGAPVYLSDVTAAARAFFERLIFPVLCYKRGEDGNPLRVLPKEKRTALIITGNITEDMLDKYGYRAIFGGMSEMTGRMLGEPGLKEPNPGTELMFVCDTYQFDDYSKYDVTMFDPAHKARHRDEHFISVDLPNARELGRRLCR